MLFGEGEAYGVYYIICAIYFACMGENGVGALLALCHIFSPFSIMDVERPTMPLFIAGKIKKKNIITHLYCGHGGQAGFIHIFELTSCSEVGEICPKTCTHTHTHNQNYRAGYSQAYLQEVPPQTFIYST